MQLWQEGWVKCCVTGCSDVEIDTLNKTVYYSDGELHEGDVVSDGSTGVYMCEIETVNAEHSEAFEQFMEWSEGNVRQELLLKLLWIWLMKV